MPLSFYLFSHTIYWTTITHSSLHSTQIFYSTLRPPLPPRRGGRIVGAKGVKYNTRTQPIESLSRAHGASKTELTIMESAWVCGRSSECYGYEAYCSCRIPNSGNGWCPWVFACSWAPFPPMGLPYLALM